jgi:hypothetical protein
MSRITNLNTLRIGTFGGWYSCWYDKEYYSFLIFRDYKIIEYLSSIFYRLRLPTNLFYLNRINQKYYYIETNIYISKNILNRTTKSIHNNKNLFKYISLIEYILDVILFFPKKNLILKFENIINNNIQSYLIYSFYLLFLFFNNNYYYNYIFFCEFLKNVNIYKNEYSFFDKFYIFYNNYNINKLYLNIIKFNDIFSNKDENIIDIKYLSFMDPNNFFFKLLYEIYFYKFIQYIIYFIYNILYDIINLLFFSYLKKNNNLKKNIYYKIEQLLNNIYFLKKKYILLSSYKLEIFYNINLNIKKLIKTNKIFPLFINKNISNINQVNNLYYLEDRINKLIYLLFENRFNLFGYYYFSDFNLLQRESDSNYIEVFTTSVSMLYFKNINRLNNFFKLIKNHFNLLFFKFLRNSIEKSLYNNTGMFIFFLSSYYMKDFPVFDSKLLMDYIIYNLKKKNSIIEIYYNIANLQLQLNDISLDILIPFFNEMTIINNDLITNFKLIPYYNFNYSLNTALYNDIYNYEIKNKFFSIAGIRIEFKGPPKKAERSTILSYYETISNPKLSGRMPTHSIYADIDYNQSYVILKRSVFGIKIWIFHNTKILNNNFINKTIL